MSKRIAPIFAGTSDSTGPRRKKRRLPPQTQASTSASVPAESEVEGQDGSVDGLQVAGEELGLEKKQKRNTAGFVSAVPWPEHFVELQKCFKALNTVYTFCAAKKRTSTTYEGMKASVEKLIKRPLPVSDLAELRALLPDLITFAYMDRESIRVHVEGTQPGTSGSTSSDSKEKEKGQDVDVYDAFSKEEDEDEHVLFFSFNDGDLAGSSRRKDPTIKGMASLISKRNQKFVESVSALLLGCSSSPPPCPDPVEILQHAAKEHLPIRPTSIPSPTKSDREGISELRYDTDFYMRYGRPSVRMLVEELIGQEGYKDQIVEGGRVVVEERQATFGTLNFELPECVKAALENKGILGLYSHQTEALNHLYSSSGIEGVITTTSTSSGKSIIYQLPSIIEAIKDPQAKAFYVFPTKALAQDQMRSLGDLLRDCGPSLQHIKGFHTENASILFVNPDILHVTILPHEEKWRHFLRNLRVVVLDELHVYNGLFGAHVAFVMRRLRRLCAAVGNRKIKFVACSATVANPITHMQTVFGITDVQSVEEDGSPSGRKEHIVWNPPLLDDEDKRQGRASAVGETSKVFRFLLAKGVRTIVFCRVRKLCEIVMKTITADLLAEGRQDLSAKISSYRGGYSPQERRRIEKDMFEGALLGIIATSALELGIDIGTLDAVITMGFPYSLPALRQQAGRAGRRNKDSLSMLICDAFAVDQHYAQTHQNFTLNQTHQSVSISLIPSFWKVYFGEEMAEVCRRRLTGDREGFYHCHQNFQPYPANMVKIRANDDEMYKVVALSSGGGAQVLEEIEWSRAAFEAYEGAVFLHQGRSYLVGEVDHDRKLAMVRRKDVDWITRQRDFTDVDAMETRRIREIKGGTARAYYGKVRVRRVVYGYFKVDRKNNVLDTVDVDFPPFEREGDGMWIDVPRHGIEILRAKGFHVAGSIHAANHAIISLTPIFAMSTHGEVQTECKAPQKELNSKKSRRKRPARLILYDKGGNSGGICAKIFDHISLLLSTAEKTISSFLAKLGSLIVLQSILGLDIDLDKIPQQEPVLAVYGKGRGPVDDSIIIGEEVKMGKDVEILQD
ncbi:P-loop containing nucleoside triphosphate hydrolase protein [Atractiella rhizophila]|nr:P-loop containing nucleoside triphosphate hydrolase protein [Atractiella rhizophila]